MSSKSFGSGGVRQKAGLSSYREWGMHRETVGAGRWAPWGEGFCRISWRG